MYGAYMFGFGGPKSENVELHHTTLPVDEVDLLDRAFHGAATDRRPIHRHRDNRRIQEDAGRRSPLHR